MKCDEVIYFKNFFLTVEAKHIYLQLLLDDNAIINCLSFLFCLYKQHGLLQGLYLLCQTAHDTETKSPLFPYSTPILIKLLLMLT